MYQVNKIIVGIIVVSLVFSQSKVALARPVVERTMGAVANLEVKKSGASLEISGQVPKEVVEVELRFESSRNRRVSKFSDVSPLNPEPPGKYASKERELWYPVIDVMLEPGMEAVTTFDVAPQTIAFNHQFYAETVASAAQVIVPANKLEVWENTLYVEPSSPVLKSFYVRQRFRVADGKFKRACKTLSNTWSGSVALLAVRGNETQEFKRVEIKDPTPVVNPTAASQSLDRQRLMNSLKDTLAYTLRSQNRDPESPTRGGLYLFYDLEARTFRTSYWVWGWAPSVKFLLEAERMPEVASSFKTEQLAKVAKEIGQASLRFQVKDKNHPANGSVLVRWDRGLGFEFGHKKCLSTSDGNFLSGWAWLPLAEASGKKNSEYLVAAKTLAATTERLMNEFELIPQDYYDDQKTWADHTLDESGFGVEGLAELYRATGDQRYQQLGVRYIEQHLAKLEQADGLWGRRWIHSTKSTVPNAYHTRGQGWAMEGLLAAHRLQPDGGKYLEKAKRMAEHLMRCQQPAGHWAYPFNQPNQKIGADEKAIALWSLLFYRLYKETNDARHLATARKALLWCVNNQYRGADTEATGSIVGVSAASAVGYRHWYPVSCTYASAFFGLAVIEELKLARAK